MTTASTSTAALPVRAYLRFYLLALLPPLCAILGGLAYREFVVHAILTNIVINAIILGTAVAGIVLMILNIAGIVREWRGFARLRAAPLGETGMKALSGLAGARLIEHLDELRGGHLSLLDQSHLHEEMTELREVMNGRQELGQYLVGLMVALGLLGTFIGLLETLVGVGELIGSFGGNSTNLDESFKALLGNLQRPLAAMGTAFAASMFGLIGSLLLGLVQIVVRSAQGAFFNYAHGVVGEIAQIAETLPETAEAPSNQLWLVGVVDSMLVAQRELVDHVGALRKEAHRNEMRVGLLADTQGAIIDLTRELAGNATRQTETNAQLAGLPLMVAPVADVLVELRERMNADGERLSQWRSDLDRRHAAVLRYLGQLARRNARQMSDIMARQGDANRALLAELVGEYERGERRSARRHDMLLSTSERIAQTLDRLDERVRNDDDIANRALAQSTQAQADMLARLDAIVEHVQRWIDRTAVVQTEMAADTSGGLEHMLERLELFERKLSHELRIAVDAVESSKKAMA